MSLGDYGQVIMDGIDNAHEIVYAQRIKKVADMKVDGSCPVAV